MGPSTQGDEGGHGHGRTPAVRPDDERDQQARGRLHEPVAQPSGHQHGQDRSEPA
jgi:hypothetical protein